MLFLLTVHAVKRYLTPAVELSYQNITSNIEDWNTDLAIMFYAPWCKYCKQLSPSFDQISTLHAQSKDLIVGRFNCEVPAKHEGDVFCSSSLHLSLLRTTEVCKVLGVDRYPSVYFMGYGNFNQGPGGNIIGRNPEPRLVKFTAALYPEAILDWISMLVQVSHFNRRWDDLVGLFTGKTRHQRKLQVVRQQIDALQTKVGSLSSELGKYKAFEVFDG